MQQILANQPATALAHISNRLAESWIEAAVEGTSPARSGWSDRHDGWTADRIRIFLRALAECGVAADAARAAGMSRQKAYAFRNSARGRAFAFAWRTALLRARDRLADEVMSRALHGCVDVIVRNGEIWGERHRFDNRLTMSVLTRLDNLAELPKVQDDAPALVEPEMEELIDRVVEGPAATAAFLRARVPTGYNRQDHAQHLERAQRYCETGSGLAEEEPEEEEIDEEGEGEEIDWDELMSEEEEHPGKAPEDEWHLSPSSPSSCAREETGQGDSSCAPLRHPRGGGGPAPLSGKAEEHRDARLRGHDAEDGDGNPASAAEPALAYSPDRHPRGAEGDYRSTGGPASSVTVEEEEQRGEGRDDISSTNAPAEPEPPTPQPAALPPFPPTTAEPQWILGDDGIAIPLINGRLPRHLRHRSRSTGT